MSEQGLDEDLRTAGAPEGEPRVREEDLLGAAALRRPRGFEAPLWAARNKGWVSPEDLEEINALLERLCMLTSQVRGEGRELMQSFAFVLAPAVPRAKRRGQD